MGADRDRADAAVPPPRAPGSSWLARNHGQRTVAGSWWGATLAGGCLDRGTLVKAPPPHRDSAADHSAIAALYHACSSGKIRDRTCTCIVGSLRYPDRQSAPLIEYGACARGSRRRVRSFRGGRVADRDNSSGRSRRSRRRTSRRSDPVGDAPGRMSSNHSGPLASRC